LNGMDGMNGVGDGAGGRIGERSGSLEGTGRVAGMLLAAVGLVDRA